MVVQRTNSGDVVEVVRIPLRHNQMVWEVLQRYEHWQRFTEEGREVTDMMEVGCRVAGCEEHGSPSWMCRHEMMHVENGEDF